MHTESRIDLYNLLSNKRDKILVQIIIAKKIKGNTKVYLRVMGKQRSSPSQWFDFSGDLGQCWIEKAKTPDIFSRTAKFRHKKQLTETEFLELIEMDML